MFSCRWDLYITFFQGSGNITQKVEDRMEDLEDVKERYTMLSYGHDIAAAHMDSVQLYSYLYIINTITWL